MPSKSPVEGFCAARGGTWLSEDEVRGHLASLLRLTNVGFLIGAGASCGSPGGKTVAQVWESFRAEYPKDLAWLKTEKFLGDNADVANPEVLLSALDLARLEWKRAGRPRRLARLEAARANIIRTLIGGATLKNRFWAGRTGGAELENHRKLLQKVVGAREPGQAPPWFFSTNYDLAIEWAAEALGIEVSSGFAGIHTRSFSPARFDLGLRNMAARGEARFGAFNIYLAKLHGSLTWREVDGSIVEEPAATAWQRIKDFKTGKSDRSPGVLVAPHAGKYLDTVGFVLGEVFRRLAEFLARPQSCLIVSGYSFADSHVNRLIFSGLQNPTLHVVVYLPELLENEGNLTAAGKPREFQQLISNKLHQVTFVGGGARAYFDMLADDLPEPALMDSQQQVISEFVRALGKQPAIGTD